MANSLDFQSGNRSSTLRQDTKFNGESYGYVVGFQTRLTGIETLTSRQIYIYRFVMNNKQLEEMVKISLASRISPMSYQDLIRSLNTKVDKHYE